MSKKIQKPLIAVVMGSKSDWPIMEHCVQMLKTFSLASHVQVLSAHRTPAAMARFAEEAQARGFALIIAGAGGAAHLPGMMASHTCLPVLGVPVPTRHLQGLDSLLSIVQMPKGVPVATFAIGEAGATNAALAAVAILALHDERLAKKLTTFRRTQTAVVKKLSMRPVAVRRRRTEVVKKLSAP